MRHRRPSRKACAEGDYYVFDWFRLCGHGRIISDFTAPETMEILMKKTLPQKLFPWFHFSKPQPFHGVVSGNYFSIRTFQVETFGRFINFNPQIQGKVSETESGSIIEFVVSIGWSFVKVHAFIYGSLVAWIGLHMTIPDNDVNVPFNIGEELKTLFELAMLIGLIMSLNFIVSLFYLPKQARSRYWRLRKLFARKQRNALRIRVVGETNP
ncbi:MAG: hypothetical protein FD163_1686 [Hyphomonadaceae bacterium]|nr:MAG: hypothetical protein FD128_1004 [Hyphomonadaceae bacterium]KAF0184989.1 MAG: hypothetical protein FD163_1686 [Hyphomonadaceae bacterium]